MYCCAVFLYIQGFVTQTSHGTGPRRRRLCLSYLWWPLHESKPSITRTPGARAHSLKSMWESCSGIIPQQLRCNLQLFLHMCICVHTQRQTYTETHMYRQTQACDAHRDTHMKRPTDVQRNMQTRTDARKPAGPCRQAHTAHTQRTLLFSFGAACKGCIKYLTK